jgi:hypothetical protein
MNRSIVTVFAVVIAASGVAAVPTRAATEADTQAASPVVNAVWVERKQQFTYFGDTTFYSCDGLRDKVRYILELAGARDDLVVSASCIETTGKLDPMPGVRIRAHFAREATPEVLAELEAGAAERELISRVTGKDQGVDVATAQFPARWQRVELQSTPRGRIASGDCELVEQLVRHVLEPAGVRVIDSPGVGCMRRSSPIHPVRVQLETLQPVPPPDVAPLPEPPSEGTPAPAPPADAPTAPTATTG